MITSAHVIVFDSHTDTVTTVQDVEIKQLRVQDKDPNRQVIDLHTTHLDGTKANVPLRELIHPMYTVSQQGVPTNVNKQQKIVVGKYHQWYHSALHDTVYFELCVPYSHHPNALICVDFGAMQQIVHCLREKQIPKFPVHAPSVKQARSPVLRTEIDAAATPLIDSNENGGDVMLQLFDGTRVQMEHVLPKDGRNELQVTAVFSCPPIPDAPFAGTIPSSEYVLHSSMKETFAGMAERALSSPVSFQDKVHLGHASLHFLRNQGGMLPRMVATVRKRSHKGTTAMGCFPQHLHVGLNPIVTNANDRACGTMNPDTCSMAHETYEDQEHLKQSVVRIWHPALGSAVAVRFHVFVDGAKGEVAAVNFTPDNPLWYIGLLRCKLSTELRGPLRDDLDDILNRAKFPPRTDCYKDTEEGRERFRMVHALLEGPADSTSYASFVSNREHRLELDPCLEQGHQDALLLKHDALCFQLHLVVDGARNATNGACIAGQVVPSLLRKAHTYTSFAGALKGHRIAPDGKNCLYDSATVDLQAQRYLSWETIPTLGEETDRSVDMNKQYHYFCVAHTGLNALVDVLTMAETFGASPTTPTANLVRMPSSEHQFRADVSFGIGNDKKRMPDFTGPLPLVRERVVTEKGSIKSVRRKGKTLEMQTVYFDDGSQLTLPRNSPLVRTDERDGKIKYVPRVKDARNMSLRKTHCIGKPRHMIMFTGLETVAQQIDREHITDDMVIDGTTTVLQGQEMHLLKLISEQQFARSGPYRVTIGKGPSRVSFLGDRECDELPQIRNEVDANNKWSEGFRPVIGYTKQRRKNMEGHHWVYPTYLEKKQSKPSAAESRPLKKQRRLSSYCTSTTV